jgi:transposase
LFNLPFLFEHGQICGLINSTLLLGNSEVMYYSTKYSEEVINIGNVQTKYYTNVEPRLDEIKNWVDTGVPKCDIAIRLEVSPWSLEDYAKRHPELNKIINKDDKWNANILSRLSEVKDYIMEGMPIREICEKLDVSIDSWYRYQKEHESFAELIEMGRQACCNRVESSLLKLCTGYEYEELKTIVEEDKNGKKHTRIEKTKRHQPPSAQAISFFLRNRMPEVWSERKELILDTKQNEESRKQLFLEMVNDSVEVDYKEVDNYDAESKNLLNDEQNE